MVAVLTASPTRSKVRPHCGTTSSRRYERRRPEKTPLYKVVAEHLEGWLETRAVAEHPVSAHVERELRSYLTCGILCFGFGRGRCASCGQGFVVAFSCKGRGVCPSCNGRRMAQTAAHLVDRVIPPVPVRQWVISVPKRLRCFLADRPSAVAALTRIFIEEIERLLCTAAGPTRAGDRPSVARPRLGAVSFLHRFGSALNHHVHLHACATDGVFVPTGGGPPARLRASRLPKPVAGPADHPGRSGHAHREGAPACRALVPHAAAHRRRCGQRQSRSREQRVFSRRQCPDHAQ